MGLGLLLGPLCSGEGVSGKHGQFSDASVHFDGSIQSRAARVPGNHRVTCSAEIPDVGGFVRYCRGFGDRSRLPEALGYLVQNPAI